MGNWQFNDGAGIYNFCKCNKKNPKKCKAVLLRSEKPEKTSIEKDEENQEKKAINKERQEIEIVGKELVKVIWRSMVFLDNPMNVTPLFPYS